MKFVFQSMLRLLPVLSLQVWILALGRFLSEVGTGFTLFYAPIFFVNRLGMSTTAVGFALGIGSISGILGRILGGIGVDSPHVGRRNTLLVSALISAIGSSVLAIANDFVTLLAGNVIGGFGIGLYWPATEAVVADVTSVQHRHEAFAITRLADNLGLGMGIVLAGALVSITSNYRLLFVIDAISFIVFFAIVFGVIRETYQPQFPQDKTQGSIDSWLSALRNRPFVIYLIVNIIFTTYISQLHSTLPVYFKNFVKIGNSGFSESTISALFAWHLVIAILLQLPVARVSRRFAVEKALMISAILWAIGFCCIWACGIVHKGQFFWAILALAIFAVAIISYTPAASALVTDLAPESQRGVYFSINSLCWAIGYFIGPPLGGLALDRTAVLANNFWLGFSFSVVITIAILKYLKANTDQMYRR